MVRVRFAALIACVGALVTLTACIPPADSPPTTTLPGPGKVTGVTSFELSGHRNCFTLDGNRPAACAGWNSWSSFATPAVSLPDTDGATDMASGWLSDCAVAAGRVMCQGANEYGQLGTATPLGEYATAPVEIPGIDTAVEVVGAFATFCARLSSGSVNCWGYNRYGMLGDGTDTDSATPVAVVGVNDAVALSGDSNGFCALRSTGQVACWGLAGRGDGNPWLSQLTPTNVAGISNAVVVVRPRPNTGPVCAVLADDTVRCWGYNGIGQLGDGTTTDRISPVAPTGLGQVQDLALDGTGGCAVGNEGTVTCWGNNDHGRVGDGTTTDRLVPTTVVGLPGPAASVATSSQHSCATLASGELWCWGDNTHGQLGDGTTTASLVPVRASGLVDVAEAQVAFGYSCALDAGTDLWCWGNPGNSSLGIAGSGYGQLTVPTRVDTPMNPPSTT